VSQLVVESVLLASAGGALGVALAALVVGALPAIGPGWAPRLENVTIEWTVGAYAAGATAVTALLFGLLPALQLARSDVNDTLRHGGRGTVGSSPRLRGALVAAEIALAFVLVAGAGLLLRSFERLSAADPGFESAGVLTARLSLPSARYPGEGDAAAFFARLRERVAALPGVQEVGLGSDLPWTGYDENTGFDIAGRSFPPGEGPEARFHMMTPGYFRAVGVPLLAGRDLEPGDRAGAPLVVLVNERLARRFWGEPSAAVGARLGLWGDERTIVGVVGDVADTPWADAAEPALYFPQAQQYYGQDMLLAVRTSVDPLSLADDAARAVREIDAALPLANVATLESVAGDAFATRRFLLVLVGAFGLTALFLAVVGVYGVMAQAVGQRAAEFGVRQALGAAPGDIRRLVLRGGVVLAATGIAAGVLLAAASTRLLESMLYHVSPLDPLTFGLVGLVLLAVALLASYAPARRATRVDPAAVLRGEA
jgi:predicted permease